MSDRETLLRAGHEACTFTNNGQPDQIEASYHVMQQFSIPAKEAQAVGVGAFETLCRADGSMSSVETSSAAAATPRPNDAGAPSAGPVQSQLMRVTLPAGQRLWALQGHRSADRDVARTTRSRGGNGLPPASAADRTL